MNEFEDHIIITDLIEQKHKLEDELIRKKALVEELLNKNEYYHKLIENALDITMVLSKDKSIRYINGPVKQVFGAESSTMVGMSLAEIIKKDERENFEQHISTIISGNGISRTSQFSILQSDGTEKILECISQKIDSSNGDNNILIKSRDITERANVQEILRNSQNQLLTAQKLARVGSWEWEYENDIFRWSNELQCMLGQDIETSESKIDDFLALIHKDDRSKFRKVLEEAIQNKSVFEVDLRYWKKDGKTQILHIHGEILLVDNDKGRIIGTGQDITNLKQIEEQLREYSEQLRHINVKQDMIIENERNQIAREIHDDLGQMLAVLKMDVYLLKEKVKLELDEDMTQNFRADMRNIFSRFDLLINSVQQITHKLRPEVINDLGLIEAIKWQCRDFESQTGIKCTFEDRSGDMGDMIIEYKNAFFRIVQQALKNVGEHADATNALVRLKYDSKYLTLKIKDNGIGIKQDKIQHPNSMGLLSMKERSHYLGGNFSIQRLPGNGTEIFLKIPAEEILFKY